MSKALALIMRLAITWSVNYFVVSLIGLCFGVTTTALQATGVILFLLYVRVMWGDK